MFVLFHLTWTVFAANSHEIDGDLYQQDRQNKKRKKNGEFVKSECFFDLSLSRLSFSLIQPRHESTRATIHHILQLSLDKVLSLFQFQSGWLKVVTRWLAKFKSAHQLKWHRFSSFRWKNILEMTAKALKKTVQKLTN